MNCPGHCALYSAGAYSYRELPLRVAEAGVLHRDELAGALHGLLRVRMFSQDDAHVFCTPEQVEDEVLACLDFGYAIYDKLGLEINVELSTRPENRLGADEEWDAAEAALSQALERRGLAYAVNEGDGAFYGPKIDLHMLDSLGRSWQLGTVQLDFQMPQRFGLRYQGADNAEHTPVMIHRALIGSFERFIGILIEHFAGAFPFWLAPVQIRVIPVGEAHRGPARALAAKLAPYRVEVDESDETVGKKIRNAEVAKIPFAIVYGDRESDEALAVREHGGGQSTKSLSELRDVLATLTA
jgi:threonyl-tRNA synthetase